MTIIFCTSFSVLLVNCYCIAIFPVSLLLHVFEAPVVFMFVLLEMK